MPLQRRIVRALFRPTLEVLETRETPAVLASTFGQSPLAFEWNVGQADPGVVFRSRGPGFDLWLTGDTTAVFGIPHVDSQTGQTTGQDVFRLQPVDGNSSPELFGTDQLVSRSNYFEGSDPTQWHTNVPQFGGVTYSNIYPGVDLSFHSHTLQDRQFEYTVTLHPGADPSSVRLRWQGLQSVTQDAQGRVLLQTSDGTVVQDTPLLYQEGGDGTQPAVAGHMVLLNQDEEGLVVTGPYDHAKDLKLDVVISCPSYLGGSGDDYANGIAADNLGSYVVGRVTNTSFPTTDGFHSSAGQSTDAFVTRVADPDNHILYTTYLGGGGNDVANAVYYSAQGLYVAGQADGSFPTTANAYQASGTGKVGFVTDLNASGDALLYSTCFGVDGTNIAGIAADFNGNTWLTGSTPQGAGSGFPTTSGAFQTNYGGGNTDAFVAKLNPAGSGLGYSTFLGGSSDDFGTAVKVDNQGSAYVTGYTSSSDFKISGGLYTTYQGGSNDAFVVKMSPDGSAESYGTFLGGTGDDRAYAIAVDINNQAFVTGSTDSTSFPVVSGASQSTLAGGTDAFVAGLSADGTTLTMSTYLGGSGNDAGYGIAVDYPGNPPRLLVAGTTASSDFPTLQAFQSTPGGGTDGFVTRLTSTGGLSDSSYLGGSGNDEVRGVSTPLGIYVAGNTTSGNLPEAADGYPTSNVAAHDIFTYRLLEPDTTRLVFLQQPGTVQAGDPFDSPVQVAIEDANGISDSLDGFTVSITLLDSPSWATPDGTLSAFVVNGVATFPDLSVSSAGNFTLRAMLRSNGKLYGATSDPYQANRVTLFGASVPEFHPVGTLVGTLDAAEGTTSHTFTFALVSGPGSDGNGAFTLNGNQLFSADSFDFSVQSSYHIRVRATDDTGHSLEQVLTVRVVDITQITDSHRVLTIDVRPQPQALHVPRGRLSPSAAPAGHHFAFTDGPVQDTMILDGTLLTVDTASVDSVVFLGDAGDSVVVTGGAGAHTLTLSPNGGTFSGGSTPVDIIGPGNITVRGGSHDVAQLTGSAGNDVFISTPTSATLSGVGFHWQLDGFHSVSIAGGGGKDTARLSGSAGRDTFLGKPTSSMLSGPGYSDTVQDFRSVIVTAVPGGADRATLYDSAGDDIFTGSPTSSTLKGSSFSYTVKNFPTVSVIASKGTDKAFLSDSKGNDHFVGSKTMGTLSGAGYSILLVMLDDVTLNGKAGGKNTIHLSHLLYKLHLSGVWIPV
jgi:hypothetical protein